MMDKSFFNKEKKMPKYKKPIDYRKYFRLFFRLALIGLIVGSCTTSVTWLGQMGIHTSPRYKPSYYNYNNNYSNSTREAEVEEIVPEEESVQHTGYYGGY